MFLNAEKAYVINLRCKLYMSFQILMMFEAINIPCYLSRCSRLITLNIINTYDGIFPKQLNSFTYYTGRVNCSKYY